MCYQCWIIIKLHDVFCFMKILRLLIEKQRRDIIVDAAFSIIFGQRNSLFFFLLRKCFSSRHKSCEKFVWLQHCALQLWMELTGDEESV